MVGVGLRLYRDLVEHTDETPNLRTASSAPTNFGFSIDMDWRLPANAAAILRLNKLICAFGHFLLAPAGIHPHVPDMQACVATDAALPSAFEASQARLRYVPKDVSTAMT